MRSHPAPLVQVTLVGYGDQLAVQRRDLGELDGRAPVVRPELEVVAEPERALREAELLLARCPGQRSRRPGIDKFCMQSKTDIVTTLELGAKKSQVSENCQVLRNLCVQADT